jgi:hypothetical protein
MALAQATDQAPSLRELFRETGGRHHRLDDACHSHLHLRLPEMFKRRIEDMAHQCPHQRRDMSFQHKTPSKEVRELFHFLSLGVPAFSNGQIF